MIDTIRFNIPADEWLLNEIRHKGTVFSKINNELNTLIFSHIFKQEVLGSYDRNVNLYIDSESLILEFSIPKYYSGCNIILVYAEEIESICEHLYTQLVKIYPHFPVTYTWLIERIDLCYAWKMETQEMAEHVMRLLKNIEISKQKKIYYEESVMWKTQATCTKFYLKLPEYYKHDYKELKKLNYEVYAERMLQYANGLIRFEVTLRKLGIKQEFGINKLYLQSDKINTVQVTKILNKFLNKFIYTHNLVDTPDTAFNKLAYLFDNKKCLRLYAFRNLWFSKDSKDRLKVKHSLSRVQIYRNLRDLAGAKVGMENAKDYKNISLTIPSPYVINTYAGGLASASHQCYLTYNKQSKNKSQISQVL
jgi:II/X family phage/plasmid replication protein